MGGESASCTSDRGYYAPNNATTGHVYADDDGCVQNAWVSVANDPWSSGNFIWTGHDYKGEPTPFNWPVSLVVLCTHGCACCSLDGSPAQSDESG